MEKAIARKQAEIVQRQEAAQPVRLAQKELHRRQQQLAELTARLHLRHCRLLKRFARHRARQGELERELAERQATRDAIDTATLCRERELEKDQIMLDLQVLLTSLHDWARRAHQR